MTATAPPSGPDTEPALPGPDGADPRAPGEAARSGPGAAGAGPATVLRRGFRLLATTARLHPRPFAASVFGALLFGLTAVGGTAVLAWVTDEVVVAGLEGDVARTTVVAGALALIGTTLVRSSGVLLRRFFGRMVGRRMQRTWFGRVIDAYLEVPLAYFGRHPAGELLAHADADVERAVIAMEPVPFSLGAVVMAGASVVALAVVDPVLMLVGFVLFPALALLGRHYSRHVEAPAALAQAHTGAVSAVAHESFDGALVVKTLGLEGREVARLSAAAEDLRRARLGVGELRATFDPGLDTLPNLGMIALLALGAWRVSTDAITTGDLVGAIALFGILQFPMRVIGYLFEELPRAVVAADRLHRVLAEPRRPAPRPDQTAALPAGPLAVDVRGLRFGYGDHEVLAGLDMALAPGEVVALVGATGSGKSTLCHLLAHLHPSPGGEVRVGGVLLDAAEPAEVRRRIAVAFQEAFLFAATVRENLALDEPVDDDDLAWALDLARATRFVAHLPGGLDQGLGERGVTLSGGQRQRLALARALLRRPGLLLLDDATSAVDPVIEQEILDGLRRSLRATTLVVAHRLSTIRLADRVLFLDGGRIVADGAHEDLLAAVPAYALLARAYEQDGR